MADVPAAGVEDRSRELLRLGAATVGESGGRACSSALRAAWPGASLAGPAYTLSCVTGDNLALHIAVTRAPAGSILVGTASVDRGNWGEVLTTGAEARGIAGLVLDGGVRDVHALRSHGFPVFSTAISLVGAQKVGPGSVGAPVVVSGITVSTGDWVVADGDGVAFVAAAELDAVIAAGAARERYEAEVMAKLRAGATTVELFGLDSAAVSIAPPS